jgi:hypothetical protein
MVRREMVEEVEAVSDLHRLQVHRRGVVAVDVLPHR